MDGAPWPAGHGGAKIDRAERRRAAVKLSVAGWSYDRIYRERPELGYNNRQAVYRDIQAALKEAREKQNLAAGELIAKEMMRLDNAVAAITEIMQKDHFAHSGGNVVRRNVGTEDEPVWEEIHDDGPRLAAANALVRASESIRRLTGIDAPSKVEAQVDGTVAYVVKATAEELENL